MKKGTEDDKWQDRFQKHTSTFTHTIDLSWGKQEAQEQQWRAETRLS